jgi:hypothetical protein
VRGLILEIVEGPTLGKQIARGPLPVAEALTIAQQIADAHDGQTPQRLHTQAGYMTASDFDCV